MHESVLAYTDHSAVSSTDEERMASMKNAEIGRIDENDKPISTDEALKESSEARTPVTTTASTSTTASTASTTASTTPTTAAPASTAPASPAASTAPVSTTAEAAIPAPTVAP